MDLDISIDPEDLITESSLGEQQNTVRNISPILPQRLTKKKSGSKNLLGSASRGVGILRNAKSSTILGEDGNTDTSNPGNELIINQEEDDSKSIPKTFISKSNGDISILESVDSTPKDTKTTNSSRTSSRLSKKSKKSIKSAKKKKKVNAEKIEISLNQEVEIQTNISFDYFENIENKLKNIELRENDEDTNKEESQSAEQPTQISKSNVIFISNEDGKQSISKLTENLSKEKRNDNSQIIEETIEDTFEMMFETYIKQNPDVKNRTFFRSSITSIINQIRKRETEDTQKIENWKIRYSKLQEQWKQCMNDFDILLKEKENIRLERDSLLCTLKDDFSKRALLQGVRISDSKFMKDLFIIIMQQSVNGIRESLNASYAILWVFEQESNTLKSITISPNSSSVEEDAENVAQKKISEEGLTIPCTRDLIGESFQKSEAINLFSSFKDETHNQIVDQLLNISTKTMLCYPLISPKTQTAIGILQLINKSVLSKKKAARFTVDDEEKLNQYTFIISRFLESARDFYSFGRGSRKQFVSSTPTRIGRSNEQETIEFLKFHGGLLPVHVKSYITEMYAKQMEMTTLYEQLKSEVKEMRQQLKEKDQIIQNLKFNQYIFVEDPNKKTKKNELYKNITDLEKLVQAKKKEISKIEISTLRNNPVKTKKQDRNLNVSYDDSESIDLQQTSKTKTEIEDHENTRFVDSRTKLLIEAQKKNRKKTIYADIYVDMFAEHPIPLMLLSKYFQVVHVNRALCKTLEYTQEFIIGKLFSAIATKVSHSSLGTLFRQEEVDNIRIRIGTKEFVSENEETESTKLFQLKIKDIGYVDTKFKLINNQVPLEGPLYLICFMEKSNETALK